MTSNADGAIRDIIKILDFAPEYDLLADWIARQVFNVCYDLNDCDELGSYLDAQIIAWLRHTVTNYDIMITPNLENSGADSEDFDADEELRMQDEKNIEAKFHANYEARNIIKQHHGKIEHPVECRLCDTWKDKISDIPIQ